MTAVRYAIEHVTTYVHGGGASTSQHVAYLAPREVSSQRVIEHSVTTDPAASDETLRTDYFGNPVRYFTILTPYSRLEVASHSVIDVCRGPAFQVETSPPWEAVRDALRYRPDVPCADATEFLFRSPYVAVAPELAAFAGTEFVPGRPVLEAAVALMRRIHAEFTFDPAATSVTTPVTRVLTERHGVCQDFAHLQIACLRSVGLAARYVSGYLLTDPPPGQPRLIGADASHAWLSVYCPEQGWMDLDPTNDVVPALRHITLAWGRDYGDVSPLRGVALGGDDHAPQVGVSVVLVDPDRTS